MLLIPVEEPVEGDGIQSGNTHQSIDYSGKCSSGTEDAIHYVVAEQSYNAPYDSTDYGQCETYAV